MEKLYTFLGERYNLGEVAQEVDRTLQNMINDLADMQSLYKSVLSEVKVDKLTPVDEVTKKCLELFAAFKAQVERNHANKLSNLQELISNDDYQNVIENVEKTYASMDTAIKGLDKVLQESVETKVDNFLRYETLCQNRDYIRYALKELQLQKDYTRKYAAEHEEEADLV